MLQVLIGYNGVFLTGTHRHPQNFYGQVCLYVYRVGVETYGYGVGTGDGPRQQMSGGRSVSSSRLRRRGVGVEGGGGGLWDILLVNETGSVHTPDQSRYGDDGVQTHVIVNFT